jgi:hypothetical protein
MRWQNRWMSCRVPSVFHCRDAEAGSSPPGGVVKSTSKAGPFNRNGAHDRCADPRPGPRQGSARRLPDLDLDRTLAAVGVVLYAFQGEEEASQNGPDHGHLSASW